MECVQLSVRVIQVVLALRGLNVCAGLAEKNMSHNFTEFVAHGECDGALKCYPALWMQLLLNEQ